MKISIAVKGLQPRKEPEMGTVNVKAKAGRVAYSAPRGGKVIPTDKFITVMDTPYIRRLAEVHEDIEIQTSKSKKTAESAVVSEKKES